MVGGATVRFFDVATGNQVRNQAGHEDSIADLRFDGDALVTAGLDGTARRWNPRTGEQLRVTPVGPRAFLSGDGKRLAVVSGGGRAVVTELASGAEVGRGAIPGGDGFAQFTGAGSGLVLVGAAEFTRLEFGTPAVTRKLPTRAVEVDFLPGTHLEVGPGTRERPMRPVGVDPSGRYGFEAESVATKEQQAEYDKNSATRGPAPPFDLIRRNLDTGKEAGRFRLNGTPSATPVVSPDGKLLAVGDYGVAVYELATGRRLSAFATGGSLDAPPEWSPDGKRVAFARDGSVLGYDAAAGRFDFQLRLGQSRTHRLRWSPDGKLIAAATGTTAVVWEVPPPAPTLKASPAPPPKAP